MSVGRDEEIEFVLSEPTPWRRADEESESNFLVDVVISDVLSYRELSNIDERHLYSFGSLGAFLDIVSWEILKGFVSHELNLRENDFFTNIGESSTVKSRCYLGVHEVLVEDIREVTVCVDQHGSNCWADPDITFV